MSVLCGRYQRRFVALRLGEGSDEHRTFEGFDGWTLDRESNYTFQQSSNGPG